MVHSTTVHGEMQGAYNCRPDSKLGSAQFWAICYQDKEILLGLFKTRRGEGRRKAYDETLGLYVWFWRSRHGTLSCPEILETSEILWVWTVRLRSNYHTAAHLDYQKTSYGSSKYPKSWTVFFKFPSHKACGLDRISSEHMKRRLRYCWITSFYLTFSQLKQRCWYYGGIISRW